VSSVGTTPSQTVGPFFAFALPFADGEFAVAPDFPGAVRISGTVLDGAGDPVPDALIETWQASPDGRFPHPDDPRGPVDTPGARGWARVPTDSSGGFSFLTVKPGTLPHPSGGVEAPHINVTVLARGLLNRLVTRIYFPDEEALNGADPVLSSLPDPSRRSTLIAVADPDGSFRFDIHLQGDDETVFFAV
jgi:protocatechuate 3,4-dioxygenase alpha subunit